MIRVVEFRRRTEVVVIWMVCWREVGRRSGKHFGLAPRDTALLMSTRRRGRHDLAWFSFGPWSWKCQERLTVLMSPTMSDGAVDW